MMEAKEKGGDAINAKNLTDAPVQDGEKKPS
jgi:hypothetical protein